MYQVSLMGERDIEMWKGRRVIQAPQVRFVQLCTRGPMGINVASIFPVKMSSDVHNAKSY
jgi:hypothetical protein